MPKRSRRVVKLEELEKLEKLENINKIKNIIIKQHEIYNEYVTNTKEHNLVIEKVTEKLASDVLPKDINHFKNILRNRYHASFDLLHNCSAKIKELQKEHYRLLDII